MGGATGAKSEIRTPKSERSPKPEIRKSTAAACSPMELSKPFEERAQKQGNARRGRVSIRASDFVLLSDFGFRASDFFIQSFDSPVRAQSFTHYKRRRTEK